MTGCSMRSALCAMLMVLSSATAAAQDICKTGSSPVNPAAKTQPSSAGTFPESHARGGGGEEGATGGIGGTGATARNAKDPTGGIGGTGATARANESRGGIGGTGIVGLITGFASICVAGEEVQFDLDTPVSDNGQPTSARDLAVGQVVVVQAIPAGGALRARAIAVLHALAGPIEAIDVSAGSLRVLGESVKVLSPSALSGLQRGDWVRLSGHRQADGVLAVSRIAVLPGSSGYQAQVAGRVNVVTSDAMQVGGTRVQLDARAKASGIVRGQEVLAVGRWNGMQLIAQRIIPDPTREQLGPVRDVVLEGYVQEVVAP